MNDFTKEQDSTDLVAALHSAAYRSHGIAEASARIRTGLAAMAPEQRGAWSHVNTEALVALALYHSATAQAFAQAEILPGPAGGVLFETSVLAPLKELRDKLRELAVAIETGSAPPPLASDSPREPGDVLTFKIPGGGGEN